MATNTEIQAAGRTLSTKNSDLLKDVFVRLGQLLVDGNMYSVEDLYNLLRTEEFNRQNSQLPLSAMALMSDCSVKDMMARALREGWHTSVRAALDTISNNAWRVVDAYSMGQMTSADVSVSIKDSIEALEKVFDVLQDSLPKLKVEIQASSSEDILSNFPLLDEEEQDENIFPVEASLRVDTRGFVLEAATGNSNKQGFSGILVPLDRASDGAPAIGPSLPLYVSSAVGEQIAAAINEVRGLPLDADESFSRHANEKITGVMTSAKVENGDLIVYGHLFPFNKKETVKAINTYREELGMSINANAKGKEAVIDGRKVFEIQWMEPLGANILLKDRATWKNTQVLAAEAEEEILAIAASSDTDEYDRQYEEKNMDFFEQLNAISQSLTQIAAAQSNGEQTFNERFDAIEERQARQQRDIDSYRLEKAQQEAAIQAQREQAKEGDLAQKIAAALESRFVSIEQNQAQLAKKINPHQQPAQLTTPLVNLAAMGAGASSPLQQVRDELIAAQSQLSYIEKQGSVGSDRIALIDRIKELEAQQYSLS